MPEWTFEKLATIAKDISQVVLFAITSVLGILTYRNARRGLFQPIRTETFKLQLAALQAISERFTGKDELQLREAVGQDLLQSINAKYLIETYRHVRFGAGPPTLSGVGIGWRPLQPDVVKTLNSRLFCGSVPEADREAFWRSVGMPGLISPQEMRTGIKDVVLLRSHPLVTKQVGAAVDRFIEVVRKNQTELADAFGECAKEMWERYPTEESMKTILENNLPEGWLTNRFNRQRTHLKPLADEVLGAISAYLDVDNLSR